MQAMVVTGWGLLLLCDWFTPSGVNCLCNTLAHLTSEAAGQNRNHAAFDSQLGLCSNPAVTYQAL